jgi:DNA-binding transcriptional LysR family regulator
MELRQLRYFVAVAEELHFGRAAERLHITQPSISEQVRKLESELGVKLLERTQRRVSLTTAGAAMLEEGRRVLDQAEVARTAARTARGPATTRLRIGYLPESLPAGVVDALSHLTAEAPLVQTSVEPGSSLQLIEAVREQSLDAAVIARPAPVDGLQVTSLGAQHALAAVPVSHPNADDPRISLRRLAPERLLLMPRTINPPFHNAVASLCRDADVAPTLLEVAGGSVEHALLAVASGAGVALLPESVAERFAMPGVRFVALEDSPPAFESAVVTRPGAASPATVAFLRAVSRTRSAGTVRVLRPVAAVAA